VALTDFWVPAEQEQVDPLSFVEVLADDGDVRIITRVDRKAIAERSTAAQRVEAVKSSLSLIGLLIERKYRAGDHTTYGTNPSNRLIVISRTDLH
jgi:hypothetical protein